VVHYQQDSAPLHPDADKATKDSYFKVLLQSNCLHEDTDFDDLADQLTNTSSWNDGSEAYSVSVAHMARQITCSERPTTDDTGLRKDIQQIDYPDKHMMLMLSTDLDNVIIQAIPKNDVSLVHGIKKRYTPITPPMARQWTTG
jgi:hypothetical protein